jgi:hypothetical protein
MATVAKTTAVLTAVQLDRDIDILIAPGVMYTIAEAGSWCLYSEDKGFHSFITDEEMSEKYLVLA